MPKRFALVLALLAPVAAAGQLLPPVQVSQLPRVGEVIGGVTQTIDRVNTLPRRAARLASDRIDRIAALVRANRSAIALDQRGDPARAGEVAIDDPDDALIAAATARGFSLIERGMIEGTGIGFARFAVPAHQSLPGAIRALRTIAGRRDVTADQLHFQSGGLVRGDAAIAQPPAETASGNAQIGIVDGGVSPAINGVAVRRGFARGAPAASDHASALASLIIGAGPVRAAAPGARLWSADVYGSDPAGGSAITIARALGWLSAERVPVAVISLVGPANPILARVVQAVRARGMIIVAAVGNDGPAAPPAYPASYPGVIAVTGVDAKGRALIEAGRALHLDYAAPGADMIAADAQGRAMAVRGTSFAAPLAAARIARLYDQSDAGAISDALAMVDREATDLGRRGADPRYGRGLLCGQCATRPR